MEEAGVKILYHTLVVDVIREGNTIKGIIMESNEGRHVVIGKCIIDCTGIGYIVWKSGAPCFGEKGYPIGLKNGLPGGMLNTFYIAGVNLEKFRKFKAENLDEWGEMYGGRKMIKKAKEKGAYIIGESVIIASLFDVYNIGRVYVMNPVHKTPPDKKSWMIEDITESEIDMRKQAWELFKLIKKEVPEFENSYLERTSNLPFIGIGHRIMGDHVLSVGDMRKGRVFEDSVAINNMPPDIYESVGRFKFDIIPYDIPYRSLNSKEIDNLLTAGTTISAGTFSGSGLRYCTPSICQGQAAGTAAAIASKSNVALKNIDIKLLQDTLREQGAIVSVSDVSKEALEPYKLIKRINVTFKRQDIDEIAIPEREIAKY